MATSVLTAVLTAVGTTLGVALLFRRMVVAPLKRTTLMDVFDEHDALRLLQCTSQAHDDADALADRFERLLSVFPPTESQLRHMALAQQKLQGTGDQYEFAITLVYSMAMFVAAEQCKKDIFPREYTGDEHGRRTDPQQSASPWSDLTQ